MSDYFIFLHDMAERLSDKDHRDDKRAAIKMRGLVMNALVDSQDESDSFWGYPEHARLLRTLWVLENLSKTGCLEYGEVFAPVVRSLCEERDVFSLEIVDQPLIGNQKPEDLQDVYTRRGTPMVPSAGLSACAALLCHRLAVSGNDSEYFGRQRDDLLRYLLRNLLTAPSLMIDRTNFTFTWYCFCALNSIFNFEFSFARDAFINLDRDLKALREDQVFAYDILKLHWGDFAPDPSTDL
jgi:hypothetical protein